MEKRIYTFTFLFFSLFSFAQNSAYPDIPYSLLYDIAAEGENIITAGSCDQGFYSQDGGSTWENFEVTVDFLSMKLVPGSNGSQVYLLTKDELLLMDMSDKSISQTGVTSLSLVSGNFVEFDIKNGNIYIVGTFAAAMSDVYDFDFRRLGEFNYQTSDLINSISVTDNFIYTSTRKGLIFKTDIAAGTTSEIYDFDVTSLRNISMGSDEVGYASAGGNHPYKTQDGGQSWSQVFAFSEVSTVLAKDENTVLSINTNRVLISRDGGANVEYIPYHDDSSLGLTYAARYADDGTLWMSGTASSILKSDNDGETYTNLMPHNKSSFYSLSMNGNGYGIALGGYDHIVVTEDHGETWTQIEYTPENSNNYFDDGVVLPDGTTLIGHGDGIFKVENGNVTPYSDQSIVKIEYNEEKDYLMSARIQGGSGIISKSTDKGITWESKFVAAEFGYAMHIAGDGTIFVSGDSEKYYVSKDDGETFETVNHTFGNSVIDFSFIDSENGLASVGNKLFITSDGGQNFEQIASSYAMRNLQMISEDHVLYTTAQNSLTTLYERKNSTSWQVIASFCSSSNSSSVVDDKLWLGQNGGHLNFVQLDLSTSAEEVERNENFIVNNLIESGGSLLLDARIAGVDKIQIINQQGAVLRTHININDRIETFGLTSGLYFARIEYQGKVYTEKFVVI